MSNAPSKPVSFSRPKVGYFSNRPRSVSLPWVIYCEAFYLHVVFSFSCILVICPKLVLFLVPLQFVYLCCNLSQVYPAVILMCFISAADLLLAYLALTVPASLPYSKTGRASVKDGRRERLAFLIGVKYVTLTLELRCDTQWRNWLRHCATSRKVAGSIPDGSTGIFH